MENKKYDIEKLKKDIASYPSEVQIDVIYIAEVCNDLFGGDNKDLAHALKSVGINRGHSWYYKLLNGKYIDNGVFTAGSGTIASIANALKSIVAGVSVGGLIPHTETENVKMVRNAIDSINYRGNICKWLLITGTTGCQKSHSLTHYADTHDDKCLYLESPCTHNLEKLIKELASAMKCPRTIPKEQFITQQVKENSIIIIDNAQRLYNPTKGLTQPTFSFLQVLQDRTKCAIVLVFVDEATGEDSFSRVMFGNDKGFFEQLIGRAGGKNRVLQLPTITSDNDLLAFAKSAGFKNAGVRRLILPVLKFLASQDGKLRIALKALQDAARRASALKKEISLDDFINILPLESFNDRQLAKIEDIKQKALLCD